MCPRDIENRAEGRGLVCGDLCDCLTGVGTGQRIGVCLGDIDAVAEIGQGLKRDRAERPSTTGINLDSTYFGSFCWDLA